jgi:hypothetical protein
MKRLGNLLAGLFGLRLRRLTPLANIAEGTHEDSITKLADAALTTRFLVVKVGTDIDHIAACGANDDPLGICTDEPSAAEREVNVDLLGTAKSTRKAVASEAITAGDRIFTAAAGKVSDLSAVAGTYYCIGRALQAAAVDGDVIEFEPCFPIAVTVV